MLTTDRGLIHSIRSVRLAVEPPGIHAVLCNILNPFTGQTGVGPADQYSVEFFKSNLDLFVLDPDHLPAFQIA
jgi:hypothetical protein